MHFYNMSTRKTRLAHDVRFHLELATNADQREVTSRTYFRGVESTATYLVLSKVSVYQYKDVLLVVLDKRTHTFRQVMMSLVVDNETITAFAFKVFQNDKPGVVGVLHAVHRGVNFFQNCFHFSCLKESSLHFLESMKD